MPGFFGGRGRLGRRVRGYAHVAQDGRGIRVSQPKRFGTQIGETRRVG